MVMDCWIPRAGFSGSRCEGGGLIIRGEMEGGLRGDVFVIKVSVALLQIPMVWWPFVLSTHLFEWVFRFWDSVFQPPRLQSFK